jgi:signal transduction histidine kinase
VRFSRSIFANTALSTAAVGSCVALLAWAGARHEDLAQWRRDKTALAGALALAVDAGMLAEARSRDAVALRLERITAHQPDLASLQLFLPTAAGDWRAVLAVGPAAPLPQLMLALPDQQTLLAGESLDPGPAADGCAVVLAPVRDEELRLRAVLRVAYDPRAGRGGPAWLLLLLIVLAFGAASGWLAMRWLGRPIERLFAGGANPAADGSPTLQRLAIDIDLLLERIRPDERDPARAPDEQGAFLANTVHELRTPLTTILASLDMLRDGYATDPDEQREFLEQATTATHHLMFVVNDLLDSAALEAGRLQIESAPCFVRELLDDTMRLMRPIALSRRLQLEVLPPDGDPQVRGDRNRILQVLFNLVSNALKFTPAGGHVKLAAWQSGDEIEFTVTDDGAGVPDDARERLFTRFGRSGRHAAGTGIGLFLSKALIEQMHGSIGYRPAAPGPGSIFWFLLPRETAATQRRG